jgi:hypothetical protein
MVDRTKGVGRTVHIPAEEVLVIAEVDVAVVGKGARRAERLRSRRRQKNPFTV